jgi:hypothetical protein
MEFSFTVDSGIEPWSDNFVMQVIKLDKPEWKLYNHMWKMILLSLEAL